MKKITKKDIKTYLEDHKKQIIVGATIVGVAVTGVMLKKHGCNIHIFKSKPSREIPEVDGFKILDIADDINDGCITWLDNCRLSDCGKLGEGLIKIDRVKPDMLVTMAIVANETY